MQIQFIHSATGVSGPSNWRGSESAVLTPPLYWVAGIDHAAGHVSRRCSVVKMLFTRGTWLPRDAGYTNSAARRNVDKKVSYRQQVAHSVILSDDTINLINY